MFLDKIGRSAWSEEPLQYAVVTQTEARVSVEFRRIAIDVDAVVQTAQRSGVPHAGWWSDLWLRQ